MTTAEIAAAVLAATSLTEETGLAPMYEYRRVKRATGAPVDLESAVIHAGKACQDAAVALQRHLKGARDEATARLAQLEADGVMFGHPMWSYLDGRVNAEALASKLAAAREQFREIVEVWSTLADRIVATDADRAERAKRERDRHIANLATRPARELRATAKRLGVHVGTARAEIAAALVDAGHVLEAS